MNSLYSRVSRECLFSPGNLTAHNRYCQRIVSCKNGANICTSYACLIKCNQLWKLEAACSEKVSDVFKYSMVLACIFDEDANHFLGALMIKHEVHNMSNYINVNTCIGKRIIIMKTMHLEAITFDCL
mmetsp:Transcript_107636/g.169951  ORF Transcript_107636/g.169951 Transcript_107636/m.169951 type:complete len:127 (+) Transcript_107636:116-496(+)